MRRLVSALTLGMLVAGLMATPVLATADKVDLAPAYAGAPGGGAVIFNNSAGPNNLQLTVQLKGVKADFTYAVFLYVDCLNASCSWYGGAPVGEFTTNGVGNGTFHVNLAVAPGVHHLAVSVSTPLIPPSGGGVDQYYGPTYAALFPWGVEKTFK